MILTSAPNRREGPASWAFLRLMFYPVTVVAARGIAEIRGYFEFFRQKRRVGRTLALQIRHPRPRYFRRRRGKVPVELAFRPLLKYHKFRSCFAAIPAFRARGIANLESFQISPKACARRPLR